MTKDELKQYRNIRAEICSIQDEIKELKNQVQTIKAVTISDMPKGGLQEDFTDIIAKIDELTRLLYIKMAQLVTIQKRIENIIEKIENPRDKIIMRQYYINGMKWEDIAVSVGLKNIRHIFRIHRKILQKIKYL